MTEQSHPETAREPETPLQDSHQASLVPLPLPSWQGVRLTTGLPGLAGTLKHIPADFVVEEIPAYEPTGEGEHLFLWIEKENVAAEQLQRHIQRTLQLSPVELGVAGLKDRQAITRQYVSIPARLADRVGELDAPGIRILTAVRHRNKLKTGHLKGNRFSIRLRNVTPATITAENTAASAENTAAVTIEPGHITTAQVTEIATALLEELQRRGVPNYFGDQRFGHDGETLQLGLDLLHRRRKPHDLPASQRRFLLRLSLSAVQSLLFNQVLSARIAGGQFGVVQQGDILQVVASGGIFACEDPTVDQPRALAQEIVPTGPMFGPKMRQPTGLVWEQEQEILARLGLPDEAFTRFTDLTAGTRRPQAIFPAEVRLRSEGADLWFHFTLPSGSYATVLLQEILRSPSALVGLETEIETDGRD